MRAIRPFMKFNDSFRIQLYPFVYKQIFAGQKNVEWIVSFQNGKSSLIGHAEPLAEMMKKLVSDGVLRLDDWDYMPRYRLPMLGESHSTVMIYGPLSVMKEKNYYEQRSQICSHADCLQELSIQRQSAIWHLTARVQKAKVLHREQ